MSKDASDAYLLNFAESECNHPALSELPNFDAILVIPAYREAADFLIRLQQQSFEGTNRLLIILISNHPDNLLDADQEIALQHHSKLMDVLPNSQWQQDYLSFHQGGNNIDTLVIGRVGSYAIDSKQGVGLARKIGADIALALINQGKSVSPWVFTSDADCHLPEDYFAQIPPTNSDIAAYIYPYRHIGLEGRLLEATRLYEKRLSSYVEGLRLANSPYAFQTLGSTLCISARHYALARGFPKRSAGEDFYLLNKLAKLGKIHSLDFPVVEIQARCSDRIPFGTGPAVSSLLESDNLLLEKVFYAPILFDLLRRFIEVLNDDRTEERLDEASEEIQLAARHINIRTLFQHIESQRLSGKQRQEHTHLWFDGFKTLKFLHFLRDNYYPNLSYKQRYSSNS